MRVFAVCPNYVYLTFTSKLQDDTWLAFDSIPNYESKPYVDGNAYYPDTTLLND